MNESGVETQMSVNMKIPPAEVTQPISNKKHKLPIFLAMVFLIGVVIFIGTYFLRRNFPVSETLQMVRPTPPIAKVTDSVIPTSAVSEELLTYESSDIGFSMRYPSDIKVDEHTDEKAVYFSKMGPTIKPNSESYDGISLRIALYIPQGTLHESIAKDLENSPTSPTVIEPLTVTRLNGIKAYKTKVQNLGILTIWYLDKGNGQYIIITDSTHDTTGQGYVDMVTKMLSTVRLLY